MKNLSPIILRNIIKHFNLKNVLQYWTPSKIIDDNIKNEVLR